MMPKSQLSYSVLCVTHRPGTRESLGEFLACFGSPGTWSCVYTSCSSVVYSLNGKSMTLLTFAEQINLLKAAWCLLEKNVLFLLPLGLSQEFFISKLLYSQPHTSLVTGVHYFQSR